jgi:ribosomal protein L11 methyltransferase
MSNKWLEMHLAVPDQAVDLVSQKLVELGSTGVTAAEKTLDTFVVPSPDSLRNDPVLRAYFSYPENVEGLCRSVRLALSELAGIYPGLAETRIDCRELSDQDWARDWQQHFPPIRVGKHLVICPSWVDWEVMNDETILTLDPGQAFGTGTHATTSLCLDALAGHFSETSPPQRILDVGTGSGILAMAGAALGAAEVIACDIDCDACKVAAANIEMNGLAGRISVTGIPLDRIPGSYDLVLANILAAENIRLATLLVDHTSLQGRLVLSGILIEQEQQVIEGFATFPLELLSVTHRDEWTCIVYRRHE